MNISQAAKKALIPIESQIMHRKREAGIQLDNYGNILAQTRGTRKEIKHFYPAGERHIMAHNHTIKNAKKLSLSDEDIISGIKGNYREVRATTPDGYCHLVEIPEYSEEFYKTALELIHRHLYGLSRDADTPFHKLLRKRNRELEKKCGLKFRTILLPKVVPSHKSSNIFSGFVDNMCNFIRQFPAKCL